MARFYENYDFDCDQYELDAWLRNNITTFPTLSAYNKTKVGRVIVGNAVLDKYEISGTPNKNYGITVFKTGNVIRNTKVGSVMLVNYDNETIKPFIDEANGIWVELVSGTTKRYCFVQFEQNKYSYEASWSYGGDFHTTKVFEPYEPLNPSNKFGDSSASITLYKRYVTSAEATPNWEYVGSFAYDYFNLYGLPKYMESPESVATVRYKFTHMDTEEVVFYSDEMRIEATDWDEDYREIVFSGILTSKYPRAYAGTRLGSGFARDFSLARIRRNEFQTISETLERGLELSEIQIVGSHDGNSYSEGDLIVFDYKGVRYSGWKEDYRAIGLANDWDSRIQISINYAIGSTINREDMLKEAYGCRIKYEDGTYVPQQAVGLSAELSLDKGFDSDGDYEITIYPFEIRYSVSSPYFSAGTLTKTVYCVPLDYNQGYFSHAELVTSEPLNFDYGDTLSFSEDDYIRFFDENMNEVSERIYLTEQNFNAFVDFPHRDTVISDKVDSEIEDEMIVSPINGVFLKVPFKYTVDWYEDRLAETVQHTTTVYYWDDDFEDFTYPKQLKLDREPSLQLSLVKHFNSYQLGLVVRVALSRSEYTATFPDTSGIFDIRTTGRVYFEAIAPNGQVATYSYDISIVKYVPETLIVVGDVDANPYYDNKVARFHLPAGISFFVRYTDSQSFEVIDYSKLEFYRNQSMQTPLTEDSIVARGGEDRIFVRHKESGLSSSYAITWRVDEVVSADLVNGIQAFLGNRVSKLKTAMFDAGIVLTHESGERTQVDRIEAFDIKETEIAMNPMAIHVIIDEAEFQIPSDKVSFVSPHCSLSVGEGYVKTYNNSADSIDVRELDVVAEYYEDSEFTRKCDFSERLEYGDGFEADGNGVLANYVFDGSHVVNIDMEGLDSVDATFTIKATNRFNQEKATKEVAVQIVEIFDVFGLKLIKAKTKYKVKERFLDSDDETTVQVFYRDTQGKQRHKIVRLSDGLAVLNVYPLKGTRFMTAVRGRTVTVSSATDSNVMVQYSIDVEPNVVLTNTNHHDLVALYLENYKCPDGVDRSAYFAVERTIKGNTMEWDSTRIVNGIRVLNNGVDVSDLNVFGYFDDVGDTSKSAKLVMFQDYMPPIQGSNNITVKFPCYVSGNADLINKSRFGIMFGNNNSRNRLFVSGNPDFPNKDWHSSQANDEDLDDADLINGNFGYFEDTSECAYGETDNDVIGYDIVSNDKLLVLKSESDKETTVYFRQPQLVTALNGSGTAVTGLNNETLYQEEFSLVKGNNSVAGVSPKAIANFNGDTVFLSEDRQMCGLDLTGIIGDNQRYANSRSYYIDEDLKRTDMSDAFIWTDNKYLFLVANDKIYATHYETKSQESQQYEWFVLDIKGSSTMFKRDGTVFIGGKDGELSRFTDSYEDSVKTYIGRGTYKITVDDEAETLRIPNTEMESLNETKRYTFRNLPDKDDEDTQIYYGVGSIRNAGSADCDFTIVGGRLRLIARVNGFTDQERLNEIQSMLAEKEPIYLNRIDSSVQGIEAFYGDFQGKRLWIEEEEMSTKHDYIVKDDDGNEVDIGGLRTARVCKVLKGDADVIDIDKDGNTFRLAVNGKPIDIIRYGSQRLSNNFKGEIIEKRNVEAYYVTAPQTMGSLEYFKTVWSFTLTNDTNIPSEIEVCHANNKIPYEELKTLAHISKDALGFDLDDFNFNSVDFDKNVVPRTYTSKRILSGVKFLCFGFRNYNATNSVLSSMTVTYTTPYPSYSGD